MKLKSGWTLANFPIILLGIIHTISNADNCRYAVNDPLSGEEWWLSGVPSLNVTSAWDDCITGKGVVVAVVGHGIYDHVDLNKDPGLQYNPFHQSSGNFRHGTMVAGVIGAKRNDNFTVGIAYDAKIADIRMMASSFTFFETQEDITALTAFLDSVDIYSCSFVHTQMGNSITNYDEALLAQLQRGTSQGRHGKGAIYVWSTGNGGQVEESCAFDNFNNNIYTISVAGIQHTLKPLSSGEQCSAMFITAFTAIGESRDDGIVTLDLTHNVTRSFGKNSAAVPMVSGGIALALQANPYLTYRDVMHLLVKTAKPFPDKSFRPNGAGIQVSERFGFGLLNVGQMVDRAKVWRNIPGKVHCTASSTVRKWINCPHANYIMNNCGVTYIEHVEVAFEVYDTSAINLAWKLTSPSGTVSRIIPSRGKSLYDTMKIRITSVQFWGENPSGRWILQPENYQQVGSKKGVLMKWNMTVHGYHDYNSRKPSPVYQLSQSLDCQTHLNYTSLAWHRSAWGQCSHSCDGGKQTATHDCMYADSQGGVLVTDKVCTTLIGGIPYEERTCNTDPCPTYPSTHVTQGQGYCQDKDQYCQSIMTSDKNFCTGQYTNAFAMDQCRKTCNFCQDGQQATGLKDWSEWTKCTGFNGEEIQRHRPCSHEYLVSFCQGQEIQKEHCQSYWTLWSNCLPSFGTYKRKRRRVCFISTATNTRPCPEPVSQVGYCYSDNNGGWIVG